MSKLGLSVPRSELAFDAEHAVVGALIVHCERLSVPREVNAEWFLGVVPRLVFCAIQQVSKTGRLHEIIAVRDQLARVSTYRGKTDLESIGGEDMLIAVMESSYSAALFDHHMELLRVAYVRRKTREVAAWLSSVSEREDLTTAEIASRLSEAAEMAVGANTATVQGIGQIEHDGEDVGVSTGFPALDGLMSTGGYPAGQMSVVSAYHKGGKTTFKLSSAVEQLRSGRRVLWATFADLNSAQIKRRILRNLCGWARRPGSLQLAADYDEALAWLNAAPLDVYDATRLTSGFDVDTFATWLRATHERSGYDCVFIDYAQKLRATNASNRFAEGDYCSEVMARLAAQVGIPIVVGSQITPGGKDGETKTKNSRAWEEDAGLVIRLKREGSVVECEVPYSRFGPSGEFTLRWDGERLRMVAA